jgi:hypothetical protein
VVDSRALIEALLLSPVGRIAESKAAFKSACADSAVWDWGGDGDAGAIFFSADLAAAEAKTIPLKRAIIVASLNNIGFENPMPGRIICEAPRSAKPPSEQATIRVLAVVPGTQVAILDAGHRYAKLLGYEDCRTRDQQPEHNRKRQDRSRYYRPPHAAKF